MDGTAICLFGPARVDGDRRMLVVECSYFRVHPARDASEYIRFYAHGTMAGYTADPNSEWRFIISAQSTVCGRDAQSVIAYECSQLLLSAVILKILRLGAIKGRLTRADI